MSASMGFYRLRDVDRARRRASGAIDDPAEERDFDFDEAQCAFLVQLAEAVAAGLVPAGFSVDIVEGEATDHAIVMSPPDIQTVSARLGALQEFLRSPYDPLFSASLQNDSWWDTAEEFVALGLRVADALDEYAAFLAATDDRQAVVVFFG